MESAPSAAPAFGQADLSNCEREQIHLAGSIQPHGALLIVHETERVVVQASPNASQFLNLKREVLGRSLDEFPGDFLERISPHLQDPLQTIPMAVRCRMGEPASEFDGLLHRPPGEGLVIELSARVRLSTYPAMSSAPCAPSSLAAPCLRSVTKRLGSSKTLPVTTA